jgi:N-acetylmuramoyl-L-alanine amidase
MPSVLVETGFITNPTEEKYLNSEQGQDYLASAIYRACREYMTEVDLRSGIKLEQSSTPSTSSTSSTSSTISSPGPVAVPADKIIFVVQVAAAATMTELKPENFKGLKNVVEINTGERYRYVTGSFEDYSDAVRHRKKVETLYPDAFVIAFKDNKILPLQEAIELRRKK